MPQRVPMFGLVVVLALAACGGTAATTPGVTFHAPSATPTAPPTAVVTAAPTSAPTPAPTPGPTGAPGGPTASVDVFDNGFTLADLTVTKGTTVTWTNTGQRGHTVTSADGTFGSDGVLTSGKTFAHTFDSSGTFAYKCLIHSDMQGTVTVSP
ncbi:MAG: cupredoxin domain-containing protein [Chloroflexota bacterium]